MEAVLDRLAGPPVISLSDSEEEPAALPGGYLGRAPPPYSHHHHQQQQWQQRQQPALPQHLWQHPGLQATQQPYNTVDLT